MQCDKIALPTFEYLQNLQKCLERGYFLEKMIFHWQKSKNLKITKINKAFLQI
jgi:hypothetical protein